MTRKRERECVCVFVCGVSWDSPSVELLVFVVCSQNVWIGVLLGKGVEVLSAQLEDEELFGRQVRVASRRSLCWVREYWGKYDYAPGPGLVEAGLEMDMIGGYILYEVKASLPFSDVASCYN